MALKHSDSVNIDGTYYVGGLNTSYSRLVHHFGEPSRKGTADDKVSAQWKLNTPHGKAEIYDYKTSKKYAGSRSVDAENNTDWHVGSEHPAMHEYLKNHMKMVEGAPKKRSTSDGHMVR